MQLIKPNKKYIVSYLQFLEEDAYSKGKSAEEDINKIRDNIKVFLAQKCLEKVGDELELCNDGKYYPKIPTSIYWLVDKGEFIGEFGLKHILTDYSILRSGNVFYNIRPSKRKKGYATKGLQLLLLMAGKLGLDKVLICARDNNIASWKTIEKCGGMLENIITMPWEDTGDKFRRYWIAI